MAQYQRAFFRGGVPACKLRISGKWNGKIERMLDTAEGSVTVTRVWSEEFSVRAISFFRWQGEKILRLEEYWSDDGAPPEWRRKMQIGQKITED